MINLKDSLVLALTKLKTRKLRTAVTIVISSLMFAVILLILVLFEGIYQMSFKKMTKGTLNSRNVMWVVPNYGNYTGNVTLVNDNKAELDRMVDEEVAKRRVRAKELGLDFNEELTRSELMPYMKSDDGQIWPEDNSLILKRFAMVQNKEAFPKLREAVKKMATDEKYPEPFYTLRLDSGNREFFAQKNGKYDFWWAERERTEEEKEQLNFYQAPMLLAPKEIYEHYLFKDYEWKAENGTVPILLAIDELEPILGLKPLGRKATPEERVARLREVKKKAVGLKVDVCVINGIMRGILEEAKRYDEMSAEGRKNITLAYAKTNQCEVPAVIKDERDRRAKQMAERELQFRREVEPEKEREPKAMAVQYEVVGMLPSSDGSMSNGGVVDGVLHMLVGTPMLGNVIPQEMLFNSSEQLAKMQEIYPDLKFENGMPVERGKLMGNVKFYVEYSTPEQEYEMMEKGSECIKNDRGEADCEGRGRVFTLISFGSIAADLIGAKKDFLQVMKVMGLVVAGIAAVIMMGTVGRQIADAKKETAVFRAIGFKRADIYAVYLAYGFLICSLIAIVTILIAFAVATQINLAYANELTSKIAYLYNLTDEGVKVNLVGVNLIYIGAVVGLILTVGFVGVTLPMLRNMRRNPINDMRDE